MFKRLFLIVLALLFVSCSTPKPSEYSLSAQGMLDKHRALWKKTNIRDYRYEFQRSCFCLHDFTKPVLIRVKNKTVVDARFKDNNKPLSNKFKDNRQTMNKMFDTIQQAINKKAYNIKVRYNSRYGYPESVTVDYNQQMADEELYLKASHFKVE
ncbi:MAG: hypothetical protein KAH22_10485 [Thiotrichaceae bacterium]|nr:hypothetical protein [Thiotrichaceae bacterium]